MAMRGHSWLRGEGGTEARWREGAREGGREGGRERAREGGSERGREGGEWVRGGGCKRKGQEKEEGEVQHR